MTLLEKTVRVFVYVTAIAAMAVFAGCGSDQPQTVHISGRMTLAGSGKLPDKASARISLIEHDVGGGNNRIVAERTLHDLGKLPVKFDFGVRSELLGTGGQYAISAQVMDKGGNVRWQTPLPQSVEPRAQQKPAQLTLQANETGMADNIRHYQCGDDFRFDMGRSDKQAVLHLGNRQISLAAQKSATAQTKIYADDHGDRLVFAQDKTTLKVDGTSHMNCEPRGDRSTTSEGRSAAPHDGTSSETPANKMSRLPKDDDSNGSSTDDGS